MNEINYESIWLSLYRTPHQLGYVRARNLNTRYLACGRPDAPVMVLLHGTAGSLENFCRNYAPLAEHYRVIGIDMLGCGATDKPDYDCTMPEYVAHVHETLQALGIESALFIGVSLGSWIAAALEKTHPGTVKKLIMVAPAGIRSPGDEEEVKKVRDGIRARRLNASEAPTWDSIKTMLQRFVKHEDVVMDDLVAIRLDIYRRPEMQKAMPRLLAFMDHPSHLTEQQWKQLHIPILVVANVDVPNIFLQSARTIAQTAPQVTNVDLNDVDHWGQYERSEVFNRIAIDFLQGRSVPAVI